MFNWFNRSSKSAPAARGEPRIEPRAKPVLPARGATDEGSVAAADAKSLARLPLPMQKMSPNAQRILMQLPAYVSLSSACAAHPQAVERLLDQWHDAAAFHRILDSMLVDRRGGRQGFPFDVVSEFSALGEFYDLRLGPGKIEGWSSIDPR